MEERTTNSRNQVNKNQKRVLSDGAGYRWQKKGWSGEGGTSAGRRRRAGGLTSKLLNRIHIY